MKPIRAGIIGLGFIGAAHVEALRRIPGAEVYAVAQPTQAQADESAQALGIPRAYGSWEELVRDPEVDVIHNCTPNHLHYSINLAAIQAGKAILSEKPLTNSSAEAAELVELARRNRVVNAVSFNYRHYPMVQQARAMVADGTLGPVRLAYGAYLQDWLLYETDYNWRVEPQLGGPSRALADIGSHWCDTVQHVLGQRIVRVMADVATLVPERIRPKTGPRRTFLGGAESGEPIPVHTEDYASVLVEFEGGTRGNFMVSQVSPGHKNGLQFELAGAQAAVRWEQEAPEQLWIGHRDKANGELRRDGSLLLPAARPFTHYPGGHVEGWADAFKNQMLSLYAFIATGGDPVHDCPVFATFADAHYTVRVVEAILRSARSGRWIDV